LALGSIYSLTFDLYLYNHGYNFILIFLTSRRFSLHPVLRRSVCTIIIAFILLVVGIIILVTEHYVFHNSVSITTHFAEIQHTFKDAFGLLGILLKNLFLNTMENLYLKILHRYREIVKTNISVTCYIRQNHVYVKISLTSL